MCIRLLSIEIAFTPSRIPLGDIGAFEGVNGATDAQLINHFDGTLQLSVNEGTPLVLCMVGWEHVTPREMPTMTLDPKQHCS